MHDNPTVEVQNYRLKHIVESLSYVRSSTHEHLAKVALNAFGIGDQPPKLTTDYVEAIEEGIVKLTADRDRLRELLEWFDKGGGLGLDRHEYIRRTLAGERVFR